MYIPLWLDILVLRTNKIDYLKRIKYVVNNGGGYARQAESARARRTHLHD